jgi:threonine dehydrogenase-like Zn-dependent dehydrogenase
VTTNICGSDQHMVRGRTTAPEGLVLGHEITGEVIEVGPGVEFVEVGDICSVPFNIACGRCKNCKEGKTGICLNVNPDRPGSAYGYVDMGGWVGGQAEYVLVPYADWNLLVFPDGVGPFRPAAVVCSAAAIARASTAAAPTVVLRIGLLRRLLGQRRDSVDPPCFGVLPAGKLRDRPAERLA